MQNNHYFTNNPNNLKENAKTFDLNILNENFTFDTNSGVFSKNYIDFGSHTLLKTFVSQGKNLLDVGCGYGVMGIVLSKVYDLDVLMIDVNQRAVDLANINVKKNSVKAKAIHSNLYENVSQQFQQIITNPPIRAGKQVVFSIYEGAFEKLVEGGELWVVIQKKQGAPSSITHLEEIFGNCDVVDKKKGYFILKSIKDTLTI